MGAAASKARIAAGFTVSDGSRLVGGTALPFLGTERGSDGWTAILEIRGPAATVFDAYVSQARALGYDAKWSDKACTANSPQDVRCHSYGGTSSSRVDLQLRVCATCSPPIGLMTLSGGPEGSTKEAALPSDPPSVREPLLEVTLTAAEQTTARVSLPTVGQPVGQMSRLQVVKGSKVLSSANLFLCNSGSVDAVLHVTGDAGQVFRQYVKQLPHESPIRTSEGRFHGHTAQQALGDWGSVRMLEQQGRAVIAISECFDD